PPARRCWWSRRRCPAAPAPEPGHLSPRMRRLARLLGAAGLIGGVPAVVLLALMLRGALEPGGGPLRLGGRLLGAVLAGAVWLGNLARLAEALRRAAAEDALLVPSRLVPPSGI